MLIDKIAKLAGQAVRGVTQTVGTVGGAVYNEVKSVPSAFVDGLTAGQGFVSKQTESDDIDLETVEPTETSGNHSSVPRDDNNNSIFK